MAERGVRAVPASERAAVCRVGDEADEPFRSLLDALAIALTLIEAAAFGRNTGAVREPRCSRSARRSSFNASPASNAYEEK